MSLGMNDLASRLMVAERSQDIREDEIEEITEAELKDFDAILNQFSRNMLELEKLIDTQPIRVAQRLLRIYGDDAERVVNKLFPDTVTREKLITALRQQRKRYTGQQWSKYGLVRSY